MDEAAGDTSLLDATALVDARRLARRHTGGRTDITWMDAPSSLELLDAAGVPVARRASVRSADSLELLVGVTRDPAFGPVVVVGAGGIDAELRDDRVALVAPVEAAEARRAIESLRLAPLLHGFHGRPELPVDSVVEVVQRVALLAAAVPEIQQLDINPLLVDPTGCVATTQRSPWPLRARRWSRCAACVPGRSATARRRPSTRPDPRVHKTSLGRHILQRHRVR